VFTGIIKEVGTVVRAEPRPNGAWLRLRIPATAEGLALGDSVNVDGVCLTAVAIDGDEVAFDAMGETLARTTLGSLLEGSPVNVEPALRVGDPLGGHNVQGHVDGVTRIRATREDGIALVVELELPGDLARYVVEKGSIAVAGVSLTVAGETEDGFELWLIPHTRAVTTLGELHVGDRVNLEVDVLAKYVERLLAARA
jgi:riboflavin synthase